MPQFHPNRTKRYPVTTLPHQPNTIGGLSLLSNGRIDLNDEIIGVAREIVMCWSRVVPRLSWPDGRISGGIGHPLTTPQYKTTHVYQSESCHRVQLSHDHYGLE